MSRLVYRKGADLIAALIPAVCLKHQDVDFIIGEFNTLRWGGNNLHATLYSDSTLDKPCLLCIRCAFCLPLYPIITVHTHTVCTYSAAVPPHGWHPIGFTLRAHDAITLCGGSVSCMTWHHSFVPLSCVLYVSQWCGFAE